MPIMPHQTLVWGYHGVTPNSLKELEATHLALEREASRLYLLLETGADLEYCQYMQAYPPILPQMTAF